MTAKKTKKKVTLESLQKELETLKKSYNKLLLLLDPKNKFITVTTENELNEIIIIDIEDILYITTELNRLRIVTVSGKVFYNYDSLANMDRKFSGHPFFVRTHKSYFANLQNAIKVKMAEGGRTLVYKTGKKNHEVPVSYTYIGKVKTFFDF